MAGNKNREITLTLNAETSGLDGIKQLQKQIKELAKEGGDSAPELQALADELDSLADQQRLINELNAVQAEAKQTKEAFEGAKTQAKSLGDTLADQKAKLDAAATAQRSVKDAVEASRRALAEAKVQLGDLEVAYAKANAVTTENGRKTKEQTQAVRDARQAIKDQKVVIAELNAELDKLDVQQSAANKQFNEANRAVNRTEAEMRRLNTTVSSSEEGYTKLNKQIGELSAKLTAAGGDATNLAAAEARITTEMQKVAAAGNAMIASLNAARGAAAGAGSALQNAFGVVGVRSAAEIKAEILQVNQSLQKLAASTQVSGAEFDRAWGAGQAKLQKLNDELKGVESAAGKATSTTGGMIPVLTNVASAMAAAFSVDKIVEATRQLDGAQRALNAVAGGATAGAREMEYVKATADRLGIGIATAAEQYANLLAATNDTGISQEQARATFEAVAGSLSVLGRSAADTEGALLALQQMASKNVVSMEELRQQLGDRLPGALPALARELGITQDAMVRMVSSGQLLAVDVFPALEKALKKTFNTEGRIESVNAQLERLKNTATQAMAALAGKDAENASAALNLLTDAAKDANVAMTGMGRVTGLAWASLRELSNWVSGAAKALVGLQPTAEETSGKVQRLRNRVIELRDSFMAAAAQSSEFRRTLSFLGVDFSKFDKQVAESKQKTDSSTDAWTAFYGALNKSQDEIDRTIAKQNKLVKSTEEEVNAANRAVAAFGTEGEKAVAAAQGAEKYADTLRALLATRQQDVAATQAQRDQMLLLIRDTGRNDEATIKQLQLLQNRLEVGQQELTETQRLIEAQDTLAATMRAQSEASLDNAARVGELRDAYAAARQRVDELRAAQVSGAATQEQVNAAELEAGKAKRVYIDAIKDQIVGIENLSRKQQTDFSVQEASIRLDIARQRSIYELAKAQGQEQRATVALTEIKRLELKQSELMAKAKQAEAEAAIALAQAKIEEVKASDKAVTVKQAEIAALEAGIRVKQIEVRIAGETASRMQSLSEVYQRVGAASGDVQRGSQTIVSGLQQVAGAADKATDSLDRMLQRQRRVNGGLSGPGGVQKDAPELTVEQMRAMGWSAVDIQNYQSDRRTSEADKAAGRVTRNVSTDGVDYYREGLARGLTEAQAKAFAQVVGGYVQGSLNNFLREYSAGPAMGAESYRTAYAGAMQRGMQEAADSITAAGLGGPFSGSAPASGGQQAPSVSRAAPAPSAPASSNQPIVINLNGQSTKLNMASPTDARQLEELLRQLTQAQTRSI